MSNAAVLQIFFDIFESSAKIEYPCYQYRDNGFQVSVKRQSGNTNFENSLDQRIHGTKPIMVPNNQNKLVTREEDVEFCKRKLLTPATLIRFILTGFNNFFSSYRFILVVVLLRI